MALTNNNLAIIKALANNDVYRAKTAALASLAEDKSKKNAEAVEYYRKLLLSTGSNLIGNLPSDMQTFLVGEMPGSFDIARHYVRLEEEKVVNDVFAMKMVADEMSKKKINYKNTTLLYGESGVGKTELGKYIAYRMNLPFFYISFSSMIDSYMGSTAKNIHKVFSFCNTFPCVLMLDEVDCIATRRSSGGGKGVDGELERTTISLMQELDRLPNHVVLIAATNRLDMVDEALLRRFSIKYKMENMPKDDLKKLAKQFLKATDSEKYISDESLNRLVDASENQGHLMPELIRMIGTGVYEDIKDTFVTEEPDIKSNIWNVQYIWETNVEAETEEDAIALARRERLSCRNTNAVEKYKAKRND